MELGFLPTNWLKSILLMHDVPMGQPRLDNHTLRQLTQFSPQLNELQAEAFKDAVGDPNNDLGSRLSIVQGPHGTGKTNLAGYMDSDVSSIDMPVR